MDPSRSAPSRCDPIVITGLGLITPLGADRESTWQRLLQGHSAGRWLDGLAGLDSGWVGCPAMLPDDLPLRADAPGEAAAPGPHPPSDPHSRDRLQRMSLLASQEACLDAGGFDSTAPDRRGCVWGTSKGHFAAATAAWNRLIGSTAAERRRSESAPVATNPVDDPWPSSWSSAPGWAVRHQLQLEGPAVVPVAACATGLVAICRAVQLLEHGECDMVLAGSADDSLHPLVLASFRRLGVLARGTVPAQLSRPFDRHRTGFVVGSGAGALVLERRSHAQQRGATWYAAWGGGGLGTDPAGLTSLTVTGEPLRRLLQQVWRAGNAPSVCQLHGTGTVLNDRVESQVIADLWGSSLAPHSCYGVKGALGHLLGAAGSVELALACLSLRDQVLPPNVNLDVIDPDCPLPFQGSQPRPRRIETLLKVSLGFGGHQAAAWLRHTDDRHQRPSAVSTSALPFRD
jgi:3-oxoacyl-[acyl-carrier-protein] synthase II